MNKDQKRVGFLFDMDGVLVDSESQYTEIWTAINRRYGDGDDRMAIRIKGQTLPEILHDNYPEELHADVTRMLYDLEGKMRYLPLPGAIETLAELKKRGLGAILVTSSNEVKMKHLREELPDLEGYFQDVVTADKISKSKPDPEGYMLGAKMLGLKPEQCVVFEDSKQGVKAGRAAGAYVVGLTTTLPGEEIAPYCDRLITSLAEVDLDEIIDILRARKPSLLTSIENNFKSIP